jgi:hypothetical protein
MKKIIILFLLVFPFIMGAQSIESISPISASQAESIVLSVTGKNTLFKSGENTIYLVGETNDTIKATTLLCMNDTLLKASFTFGSYNKRGIYTVFVYNSQMNNSLKLDNAFTLKSIIPTIISISPNSAKQGDTVELIMKLENVHCTKNNAVGSIGISYFIGSPVTVMDDSTVKIKFIVSYAHPTGVHDVLLTGFDLGLYLKKSFTINPGPQPLPQIVSVTPGSSLTYLKAVVVTIKGKNTFFKKDLSMIGLQLNTDRLGASVISIINDTLATATFDFPFVNTKLGVYDVIAINKNKTEYKLSKGFTLLENIDKPCIVSFDPITGKQGDSVVMNIRGRNTHFLKEPLCHINLWNSPYEYINAVSTIALNDTLLQAKFIFNNKHMRGKYSVEYSNSLLYPGLMAKDSFNLIIGDHPFKILSVTPSHVVQGQQNTRLFIKGNKGSLYGGPYIVKLINNKQEFYSVCYKNNDSSLYALFDFSINDSTVGKYDVLVQGLGAEAYENFTLSQGFTLDKNLNPPALTGIDLKESPQFYPYCNIVVESIRGHRFIENADIVYLRASDAPNFIILPDKTYTGVWDTTGTGRFTAHFTFEKNYYPYNLYDVVVKHRFDGLMILPKAFTLKTIYSEEPKIIDVEPKQAIQGQYFVMNLKGSKEAFMGRVNEVKLVHPIYPTIPASTTTYINDSTLSASFSLNSSARIGTYVVTVNNEQVHLLYNSFNLKSNKVTLVSISPPWAQQTDTTAIVIKGPKTHVNSLSDKVWLENRFGAQITPFKMEINSDTILTVYFAFNKSYLPVVYSVYLKSMTDTSSMFLSNAFTLIGKINTAVLKDVYTRDPLCNSNAMLEISGSNTHFYTDFDTLEFINNQTAEIIYPSKIKIYNDSTILTNVILSCGDYDILVMGKENYMLSGKLHAIPAVTVDELPKKEPFKISPNPSDGVFTLELNTDFEQADLIVFDILGKIVFEGKKLENSIQIDLSDYPAGMYFVKLVKDDLCKTEKIIKQ